MSALVGKIGSWPLRVKVPALVVALMLGIAAVISQVVLSRVGRDQESNLRLLAGAYLDGLSAAVLPPVSRRDVWEAFDALERARNQYAGISALYTVVEMPDGTVLAASDPIRFPTQSGVPPELREHFPNQDGLTIDETSGRAWMSRTLQEEGIIIGRILAEIDISRLLGVRRQVLLTLIGVNGALTLGFAALGYWLTKRMVQPLGVLSQYVDRVREGKVEPIPERYRTRIASEFGRLFERFNHMAQAVSERETLASHLAEQEKYAMLGKLASGMAHEVNNPLGGMLNAIDTIQVHGDNPAVLQKSLEFLKRGLAGIRNVVRAALVTYKGGTGTGLLTPGDLDDLPFLVQHETGARRLRLDWRNRITGAVAIDGPAVRQITLNLLLNACAASPPEGTVSVEAESDAQCLHLAVSDQGPGLPAEMARMLEEPTAFVAPPEGTTGLGLWTCLRLVVRLGGYIKVRRLAAGTEIAVTIPFATEERLDAVA